MQPINGPNGLSVPSPSVEREHSPARTSFGSLLEGRAQAAMARPQRGAVVGRDVIAAAFASQHAAPSSALFQTYAQAFGSAISPGAGGTGGGATPSGQGLSAQQQEGLFRIILDTSLRLSIGGMQSGFQVMSNQPKPELD